MVGSVSLPFGGPRGGSGLRVMGIDVEPGCKGGRPCYSVVVVEGEDARLVAKYEAVPLYRLIRLAWEHRPDIIALDNVYELGGDEHGLAKVASMLPPSTGIVQVTRLENGQYVDLRSLARLAGFEAGGKLSPSRTAYLAALLALRGYGSHVRFVEEKTRIVVSKSRQVRHGGSSNPRFQRRVRSAILRAVRSIRARLDRARLDYDLVFRKSSGGLESATFIVYAPRDRLYGVVKPYEDADVRIEIRPVYSSRIVFDSPEQGVEARSRYLIVGVDPGVSIGVAAIDISGRLVSAMSRRGIDRGDIVAWIQSLGSPVLVATDVRPAPEMVRKLAASLAVPLYEPPASLSVEEKRSLVEPYARSSPELLRVLDTHVRDALAAAIKAFKSFRAKLEQAESHAYRLGIDVDVDYVKAEVLRGATIAEALEKAINRVLSGVGPEERILRRVRRSQQEPDHQRQEADSETCSRMALELEALRARNKLLESRIAELEKELESIKMDYHILSLEYKSGLGRDQEIQRLSNRVATLQSELERLKNRYEEVVREAELLRESLLRVALGELVPGLRADDVGASTLRAIRGLGLSRVVLVLDRINPVNWERHGAELAPRLLTVLAPSRSMELRSAVERHGVPLLPLEDYEVVEAGGLALVDSRVVVDAYERLQQLRRRESEERSMSLEDLRRLLGEYRRRRAAALFKNGGQGAG